MNQYNDPFRLYEAILAHEDTEKSVGRSAFHKLRRLGVVPRVSSGNRMIIHVRIRKDVVETIESWVAQGIALNRSQAVEDCVQLVIDHGLVDELARRAQQQVDEERQRSWREALESDPVCRSLLSGVHEGESGGEAHDRP
jgi:Arc/MetJ-type ribon-helix-helix transcriptional regulator